MPQLQRNVRHTQDNFTVSPVKQGQLAKLALPARNLLNAIPSTADFMIGNFAGEQVQLVMDQTPFEAGTETADHGGCVFEIALARGKDLHDDEILRRNHADGPIA